MRAAEEVGERIARERQRRRLDVFERRRRAGSRTRDERWRREREQWPGRRGREVEHFDAPTRRRYRDEVRHGRVEAESGEREAEGLGGPPAMAESIVGRGAWAREFEAPADAEVTDRLSLVS